MGKIETMKEILPKKPKGNVIEETYKAFDNWFNNCILKLRNEIGFPVNIRLFEIGYVERELLLNSDSVTSLIFNREPLKYFLIVTPQIKSIVDNKVILLKVYLGEINKCEIKKFKDMYKEKYLKSHKLSLGTARFMHENDLPDVIQ